MLTLSFKTIEAAQAAIDLIKKWRLQSRDGLNFSAYHKYTVCLDFIGIADAPSLHMSNPHDDYWDIVAYNFHKDFKNTGAYAIFCTYISEIPAIRN